MATTSTPKKCINLLKGYPSPSLLPVALLKSAAAHTLSDPSIFIPGLAYGPDEGYGPLRESIATWLTSFYRSVSSSSNPVTSDRICITGGASQNMGCLLSVYTDPHYTRNVWIIAPAYFLAFRIFEDAGFGIDGKMRAVPEDEHGLDIQFLRAEMEKSEASAKKKGVEHPKYKPDRPRAKVYKHVIYCVPTFANPSSRTMSLDRRKALVRLAREFDALILADDVYDFLQWEAEPDKEDKKRVQGRSDHKTTAHLPRIVDIDRDLDGGAERNGADGFGNACSNGSFSKIAAPGLRVGWCEGTPKFAYGTSQTGTTTSGGAPSQLTSTYLHTLLTNPDAQHKLQTHIHTTLQPAYARRSTRLLTAITTHLIPLGFTLPQPNRDVIGGYFAWLALPPSLSCNAKTLAQRCAEEENVVIAGGNLFEVPGDADAERRTSFERNVRFCWSYEEEGLLEEGVERVGKVVRRMLEEQGKVEEAGFVVVEKEGTR